jgi:hypothetical protein
MPAKLLVTVPVDVIETAPVPLFFASMPKPVADTLMALIVTLVLVPWPLA